MERVTLPLPQGLDLPPVLLPQEVGKLLPVFLSRKNVPGVIGPQLRPEAADVGLGFGFVKDDVAVQVSFLHSSPQRGADAWRVRKRGPSGHVSSS